MVISFQQKVKQKDRWLCKIPQKVFIAMHRKFRVLLMTLEIMSRKDDLMPQTSSLQGVRVNGIAYTEVLKIWITSVACGRPLVFQQKSAPSMRPIQLTNRWPKKFTTMSSSTFALSSPNSPDINPMEYYILGVGETGFDSHPRHTILLQRAGQPLCMHNQTFPIPI